MVDTSIELIEILETVFMCKQITFGSLKNVTN